MRQIFSFVAIMQQTARMVVMMALAVSVASGCARRRKGASAPKSSTTAPVVAPRAARDLTDVMTEELKLSSEQQQRVRAILNSTAQQANAAQQQHAANRPALVAELKRINAASDKQMQQVLTTAQYQQLKARQRQMQAEMQQRRADR